MNAQVAMRQYQKVGIHAQVSEASPHGLIQLLMQGGIDRITQAKGAMEFGQTANKGMLISKGAAIICGLQAALDMERGGEIAQNLGRLYDYMIRRLTQANQKNDPAILDEVIALLREVKSGWDGIKP